MNFTPSVGLNMGFTSSLVCFKGFTPSVVCLKGFTLTVFDSSPVMLSPKKIVECLSVCLPSYLSSLVSFTCYIQSYKSHRFHAYIHTFIYIFMHINIHVHITCTTSFIHYCIDHLVSYFVSHRSVIPNMSNPETSSIVLFGHIPSVRSSLTFASSE